MKTARILLFMAATAFLAACAYVPPKEEAARRVSPDYMATGAVNNVRAYVYGSRTLLEFEGSPLFLSVRDETGASVDFERVGQYYRLSRRLDSFTVWLNGRSVTFSPAMNTRVFSTPARAPAMAAPVTAQPETVKLAAARPVPASQADADVLELLKLSEKQLAGIRHVLDAAGKNPKATGAELFTLSQRLDKLKARFSTAAAAVVQVTFRRASTTFNPDAQEAAVLIASGKAARRVNVHGYTDSRVAGPRDAKIALGRALAARQFLVDNGVQLDKIKVFSQVDGDFVAPNISKAGRRLNRRVEIEIVNTRIAELKGQPVKLATVHSRK